jgi:hypothetical protein
MLGRASYELERSELAFELPAKHGNPSGRLPNATGRFDIDLEHPERSTGSVRVDLATLEMESEADRRRALDWLELGAEIAGAERDTRRLATFSLTGIEGAEGVRLIGGRAAKRKELSGVAVGELSVHGVRAPARVAIRLDFEPGAEAPNRLVIRSRGPLVVTLGVHDIRPRDAHGVLVARELALLGENVGREAKVTFELTLALRP